MQILFKKNKKTTFFNQKLRLENDSKNGAKGCIVDLGESFPTSIYSQNLASIQPRTSPKKFGKLGIRDFEISFAFSLVLAFKLTGQGAVDLHDVLLLADLDLAAADARELLLRPSSLAEEEADIWSRHAHARLARVSAPSTASHLESK